MTITDRGEATFNENLPSKSVTDPLDVPFSILRHICTQGQNALSQQGGRYKERRKQNSFGREFQEFILHNLQILKLTITHFCIRFLSSPAKRGIGHIANVD